MQNKKFFNFLEIVYQLKTKYNESKYIILKQS